MTPNRPYLIRALYQWLLDNGVTPYVLVDATARDVVVPERYVENGRIVLNISPGAVRELQIDNDMLSFNARFGGTPMDVFVPPSAVLGIYARENGRGMLFPEEESTDPTPPERPTLKVVK
jgi:stringent starvation protein B